MCFKITEGITVFVLDWWLCILMKHMYFDGQRFARTENIFHSTVLCGKEAESICSKGKVIGKRNAFLKQNNLPKVLGHPRG